MTSPGHTMKGIQKRFYTVLPRVAASSSSPLVTVGSSTSTSRVRSNSASSARSFYTSNSSVLPLSFFESPPPPPNSRPILSSNRLPIEAKGQAEGQHHVSSQPGNSSGQPPFSLALTSPHPNSSWTPIPSSAQCSLFPYSSLSTIPSYNSSSPPPSDSYPTSKRPRPKYQFDVGAYGIPKRCRTNKMSVRDQSRFLHTRAGDDVNLAVQVGEDAYFVRENAMGVADGVGGWARVKNRDTSNLNISSPSPSALFARRLMNYCSVEVDSALERPSPQSRTTTTLPIPISRTSLRYPNRLASHFYHQPINPPLPWTSESSTGLQKHLQDSLEELEEGLDVLMILERAYESTIKAHVIAEPVHEVGILEAPTQTTATILSGPCHQSPSVAISSSSSPSKAPSIGPAPLLSGSSTALLAILDHIPFNSGSILPSLASSPNPASNTKFDAVIKIAHIGDCMGMLVRNEEIAWRSEEMWWGFNAPVQLGPSSIALPSDAHVFTLPVQADDILILASDGLSDNLWDEDVLDEVVCFRRAFLQRSDISDPDNVSGLSVNDAVLRRRTLAGMLSEALCSRARRVSEWAPRGKEDEVPFARRAREQGRVFKGGKNDDISVIVAVISPAVEQVDAS